MEIRDRKPIAGAQVWDGNKMSTRRDWVFDLTLQMKSEVVQATREAVAASLDWSQVTRHNFKIPLTAILLEKLADYLEQGPGIAKICGLDLSEFNEGERRILFYGIGQHLGTPVSMSREGMMMSDVTDEGARSGERYGQVLNTNEDKFLSSRARVHSTGQLRFHNDRCDVVALLCVTDAAIGGVSRLASVPMIHNRMLSQRPDLLELLFADFDRSRLGEEFGDNANWYSIPIFAEERGYFTSHYSRTFIEAAQLQPGVVKMTEAQWEAIELMHEIAEEVSFETAQVPGEIQLLNNHIVFHGRTAYEDSPEPDKRRLLHRLWISMANSRPLPTSYNVLFRETGAGMTRGGVLPVNGSARPAVAPSSP